MTHAAYGENTITLQEHMISPFRRELGLGSCSVYSVFHGLFCSYTSSPQTSQCHISRISGVTQIRRSDNLEIEVLEWIYDVD